MWLFWFLLEFGFAKLSPSRCSMFLAGISWFEVSNKHKNNVSNEFKGNNKESEGCPGLILDTLACGTPTQILSGFLLILSYSKNFKFAYCIGVFMLELPKFVTIYPFLVKLHTRPDFIKYALMLMTLFSCLYC